MAHAGTRGAFLEGIQCILERLLLSLNASSEEFLRVVVKEKQSDASHGIYTCKFLCSGCDQLEDMEAVVFGKQDTFFESLHFLQETLEGKSSLQLEKTDEQQDVTIIQRIICLDSAGKKRICETRKPRRAGNVKTAIQLCCVAGQDEIMKVCLKVHELMYKIYAFCSIASLEFETSVGEMKYSTTFELGDHDRVADKGIKFLTNSRHFCKSIKSLPIRFCSGEWEILPALPDSDGPSNELRLLVLTCALDTPKRDASHSKISLFFSGPSGPLLNGGRKDSSVLAVIPLSEFGLKVSDVDDDPTSEGLVTPDLILRAQASKSVPEHILIVFLFSFATQANSNSLPEKIYDCNFLRERLPNLLSINKDVVSESFVRAMKASLKGYHTRSASKRTSEEMQGAIAQTAASIREIVSASSSTLFRDTCFRLLGTADSDNLEYLVIQRLEEITEKTQANSSSKKRERDDSVDARTSNF